MAEGEWASTSAACLSGGQCAPFAPRANGILMLIAERLNFLTCNQQSGEYGAAPNVPRAGLNRRRPPGAVAKGELWCRSGPPSCRFVSEEACRIAAALAATP